MEVESILAIYRQKKLIKQVSEEVNRTSTHNLHIAGLCGSSKALIVKSCVEMSVDMHLLIFPDKETAAFFYNDMEQLYGEKELDFFDRKVLFFPSSYKKMNLLNEVDSYNVLLRTRVLQQIANNSVQVIVSYTDALIEKTLSYDKILKKSFKLFEGEEVAMDDIIEFLSENDFIYSDYVCQPGQYAIRGGIIDVFSFAEEYPYRIEFYGDKIQSLRLFDTASQMSKSIVNELVLLSNISEKLNENQKDVFFPILPKRTKIWIDKFALCVENIKFFFKENKIDNQQIKENKALKDIFIDEQDFFKEINQHTTIEFSYPLFQNVKVFTFDIIHPITFNLNFDSLIAHWLDNFEKGIQNYFGSENPNQFKRMSSIIHEVLETNSHYASLSKEYKADIKKNIINYVKLSLHEGFIDREHKIAFYTDHQVFNRYHRYTVEDKYKNKQSVLLKDIYNLQIGDYVTHIDHGIGRYEGLEKIEINGKLQEVIKIVYKNNDILYISIHSLHRISKYVGKDGIVPSLHRIGGNTWNKVKERTKSRVKEMVIDLAKLYSERKATLGFAFSADNYMQTELEASFIYEDTPDQLKATNDVKKDMEADYPMDRLICGDVGFGKTEVAIRAAFKAVYDSKQVAVLVPTTVLALQHFNSFSERLENFSCNVAYINRFTTKKKQKEIIENLKIGKIDILIGTHRILSKDVKFKDLGLLIVDEEQKFGVEAKEKIRSIAINVDTLTMSATPIPRTLQFSLMGARDISIMQTPPLNRYPIQTERHQFSEELIKKAIEQEVFRGGQVFFVHNRIDNLYEIADLIKRNFPNLKIAVAHGRMEGKILEKTMIDFVDNLYDILVTTTIIESGLDIPNVNTIIINDAQNYGLSDLHQLRGRVGRKNVKAFCYLLSPPSNALSNIANKRLRAIEEFSDIGSGFNIALYDLDIRGAGNLLGAEQSGFIADIGYEMYHKILEEAIFELQANNAIDDDKEQEYIKECVIDTDLEILIPDNYISNGGERYFLYKELNTINTENKLKEFEARLIDRFGILPWQTMELLNSIRLRWLAKDIGFEKIVLKQDKLLGYFVANSDSLYYESKQFKYILDYVINTKEKCYMKENNNKLTITFHHITGVAEAIKQLKPLLVSENL